MGRAVLLEIQVRRDPPAHKFSSVQFTRTTHTVSKDGARPAPLPSVNTSAEYKAEYIATYSLARATQIYGILGKPKGIGVFFKKVSISIQDIIKSRRCIMVYHCVSSTSGSTRSNLSKICHAR